MTRTGLALGLGLILLTGCPARQRRDAEWDRPGANLPAGSLRAFIRQTNRSLSPDMLNRIAETVVQECDRTGIDARVVAALIAHESSFNPQAVSPSGAIGLGQLMPGTARWLGVQDPYNPEQNIAGICKYLYSLDDRRPGSQDWVYILASYRLGQGTVKQALRSSGTIPSVGQDYARDILGRASRITQLG